MMTLRTYKFLLTSGSLSAMSLIWQAAILLIVGYDEYGVYAAFLSIPFAIAPIINIGIPQYITSELEVADPRSQQTLNTMLLMRFLLSILSTILLSKWLGLAQNILDYLVLILFSHNVFVVETLFLCSGQLKMAMFGKVLSTLVRLLVLALIFRPDHTSLSEALVFSELLIFGFLLWKIDLSAFANPRECLRILSGYRYATGSAILDLLNSRAFYLLLASQLFSAEDLSGVALVLNFGLAGSLMISVLARGEPHLIRSYTRSIKHYAVSKRHFVALHYLVTSLLFFALLLLLFSPGLLAFIKLVPQSIVISVVMVMILELSTHYRYTFSAEIYAYHRQQLLIQSATVAVLTFVAMIALFHWAGLISEVYVFLPVFAGVGRLVFLAINVRSIRKHLT